MSFYGSPFQADIVNQRIEGKGQYSFKDGKTYAGEFKDGQFHGLGVIHYLNGDKYEANWENGVAIRGKFTFKDGLEYQEQNWDYCTAKDRRFYSERVYGFLSGETQLSNSNQTVPPGTLDVGDGYYDPKDSSIHEYTAGTIIRLPDEDEARWMRE